MIDPTKDGIDHINIYSKGRTELGILLSNFAHTPVNLYEGDFESLEGYWYYLLTSEITPKRDILRNLHGFPAKKFGRELTKNEDWPSEHEQTRFQNCFKEAMHQKLVQHRNIYKLLKKSTLPLKHYYVYKNKIIEPENCGWILDFWEEYRNNIAALKEF